MSSDDELVDQLVAVLDIAPPAPSAERIAALRARAEASRTRGTRRAGRWFAVAAAVLALLAGAVVVRAVTGDGGETVEFAGPMVGPDGEPAPADLRIVATGIGRVVGAGHGCAADPADRRAVRGVVRRPWRLAGHAEPHLRRHVPPGSRRAHRRQPDRRRRPGAVPGRRDHRRTRRRRSTTCSPGGPARRHRRVRRVRSAALDEERHPPAVRCTADRVRRRAERAGQVAASGEAARGGDGGRRAAAAGLGRLGVERRRHRAAADGRRLHRRGGRTCARRRRRRSRGATARTSGRR